jgi:hypothetical protein
MFSWLEFNVQLWLSGKSHANCSNSPAFWQTLQLHLQVDYVMVGHFWKPYIGQAVGGELDFMVLIYGAEEQGAIQMEMTMWLR